MLKGEQINLIVAASNIAGIPLLFGLDNWYYSLIFLLTLLASVLMHLSEQKHNLPGVYPFNQLTQEFLWFDRLMAYLSGIIAVINIYVKWKMIPSWLIIYGLFGLSIVSLSETVITNQATTFAIMHSSWHSIAYTCLYILIKL